ncbi:hypothetical protein QM012_002296 [Aureobasidium pullulans]|uniref:Uncharacterized protein n=1 Tax=Aureobasidium pullulans TaxID=5580 RepID=A0ABR0TCZ1_AURPU
MTSTTDIALTNAVRINCSVSQKIYGRPVFESVTLTDWEVQKLMRPATLHNQSSQIARRIGIPLRASLEPQHERSSGIAMHWPYAVFLHMSCELNTEQNSKDWGLAPEYWSMNAGDAYVVREDGKLLCPKFLEVLCAWCYGELQPKFQVAMEEYYDVPVDKRKDVLALINLKGFEAYKEKFNKEGTIADYNWDPSRIMIEEMLRKIRAEGAEGAEKKTQE